MHFCGRTVMSWFHVLADLHRNMLPIPVVFLYFERLLEFVASRSATGKWLVNKIFESTRQKAGPIQEFQWLGLMLFVAVPFPGTGAWSGGMAASILGMNFWDAMSANFVGVLLAGILVNILVSVGTREAVFMGIAMFAISTFMWRILRFLQQKGNHEAWTLGSYAGKLCVITQCDGIVSLLTCKCN